MRLAERAFGESSRELLLPQNMMAQSEDTVSWTPKMRQVAKVEPCP